MMGQGNKGQTGSNTDGSEPIQRVDSQGNIINVNNSQMLQNNVIGSQQNATNGGDQNMQLYSSLL